MYLKYAKTRDVEIPSRGHATDAGIDFRCPVITEEFKEAVLAHKANKDGVTIVDGKIRINSGHNVTIPSGIKVEIPYGYMGLFMNKSGVASKNDVLIGAQTIDTFYSGEVHIDLHNVGEKVFEIESGMKLAQMALVPVLNCDLINVEEDELYEWMKSNDHRGEGGFGSTGR
ncbi:MAG: dUTP diphosphatase [archaeon]